MSDLFGDLPDQTKPEAAGRGAARLRMPNRNVLRFEVIDLERMVAADHPARVIWLYASRVDFSEFEAGVRSREGRPGMPQTAPQLLLALWLYATSDGVGSAREVERLCDHDPAYRWLCGGIGVNHHMLSDFRVAQGGRIDALLADHVASLSVAGLIDLDTVAQDGVKLRASAGAASFRRRKTLEVELAKAKAVLAQLSRKDDDRDGTGGPRMSRAERAAADRQKRVEAALSALDALEAKRAVQEKRNPKQTRQQKEPRASTSDPEARVMKMADGGFRPAYNVQVASDPESGVILAVTVTQAGADKRLVEPMARHLAATYGTRPRRHLVDGGYQFAPDIEAAHAAGTQVVSPPQKAKSGADPFRPKRGDGPGLRAWRQRMATPEAKALYKRRACCERIHARLRNLTLDRLHVRGLAKVQAWMGGFALAMNILTAHRLRSLKAA